MEQVFAYVIGLGASVMMPVIFTVLGCLIGIKFSQALKSGLNGIGEGLTPMVWFKWWGSLSGRVA